MTVYNDSETPLETIKSAFSQMREMSHEMTLRLPPVPVGPVNRVMDLEQICRILSDKDTDPVVRNIVWGAVVRKSRRRESGWVLAAAGLAYPSLVHKSQMLATGFDGDTVEDQADLIEAFITAIRAVNVEDPTIRDMGAVASWAAFTAVRRARRHEAASPVCAPLSDESSALAPEVGHPDIVLARAVRLGVITADEAEYIGRSYLEETPIDEILAWAGLSRATFFRYRAYAETRLVKAIRDGLL
jgi:hypothetical protein